jgi:mRNA-degrading endonuclease YafQ of YafQ-DinJ toxin-antitoxin module
MPKAKTSPRFVKAFVKLSAETQKKLDKAIALLEEKPRHPSLQSKPVEGTTGIYEARVDKRCRLTYIRLPDDTLLLRVVGRHDEVLRNP